MFTFRHVPLSQIPQDPSQPKLFIIKGFPLSKDLLQQLLDRITSNFHFPSFPRLRISLLISHCSGNTKNCAYFVRLLPMPTNFTNAKWSPTCRSMFPQFTRSFDASTGSEAEKRYSFLIIMLMLTPAYMHAKIQQTTPKNSSFCTTTLFQRLFLFFIPILFQTIFCFHFANFLRLASSLQLRIQFTFFSMHSVCFGCFTFHVFLSLLYLARCSDDTLDWELGMRDRDWEWEWGMGG